MNKAGRGGNGEIKCREYIIVIRGTRRMLDDITFKRHQHVLL